MKYRLAVAAALATGGCALPTRDNPVDPVNAPVIALRLMSRPVAPSNDACEAPEAGEELEWTEVLAADRGSCLVLDASESDDRGLNLVFRMFVVTTAGENADEILLEAGTRHAFIDPPLLRGLSLQSPTTFRVEARRAGTSDPVFSDETRLQVRNRPPDRPGLPSLSFPSTGLAGAEGAPMRAELDASAVTDPDGDPITRFEWQTVGVSPADAGECGLGDSTCTILVEAGEGRALVRLRVGEADAFSGFQDILIDRHPPAVLATENQPPSDFNTSVVVTSEVDPLFTRVPLPVTDIDVGDVGGVGQFILLTSQPQPGPFGNYTVFFSRGAVTATANLVNPTPAALVDDPAHERFWVASFALGSTAANVSVFRYSETSAPLEAINLDVATLATTSFLDSSMATDAAGRLWIAGTLTQDLLVLDTAGTIDQVSVGDGIGDSRVVYGVSTRPDPSTTEVWTLNARSPLAPSLAPAEIVRWTLTGSTIAPTGTRIALDAYDSTAMAFVTKDLLWLALSDEALVLVDVPVLIEDGLEASVLLRFPEVTETGGLFLDPLTGICYSANRSYTRLDVARLDGTFESFALDARIPLGVDESGAIFTKTTVPPFELIASAGRFDGSLRRHESFSSARPWRDESGGAVWISDAFPPTLTAFSPAGAVVDLVTGIEEASAVSGFPYVHAIAGMAGTGSLWLVLDRDANVAVPDRIARMNVRAPRPQPGVATVESIVELPPADSYLPRVLFHGAEDGNAVWTMRRPAATNIAEVVLIRPGQAPLSRFSDNYPTEVLTDAGVAVSPDGSQVCAVEQRFTGLAAPDGPWMLRAQVVSTSGNVVETANLPVQLTDTPMAVPLIGVAWEKGSCWVLVHEDGQQYRIFRPAVTTRFNATLLPAGRIPISYAATGDGRHWVLLKTAADPDGDRVIGRYGPATSPGGLPELLYPPSQVDRLVAR